MNFGGNTTIQPLQTEAGPMLPKYIPIAAILRTSSKSERFDVIGVVIYMEQVRQVKTASGASMDVHEVVIADDRSRDKKSYLSDLMAKVLQIREPSVERIIIAIGELEQKKLIDIMQEEHAWLKATIPEPEVKKIIAYIGCDNCGGHCEELASDTFKVNYTFTITDGPGELKLTAFGAECEKLFGMELADIYSKAIAENWDDFDEVATRLSTKESYFCVGPANILSRVGALRWALKAVSLK
uniref:Uncharacterized protein n=1 Tax=Chenopodium quinoa TaxID=63459 RepID=A0A803N9P2_CHEQI